MHVVDDFAVMLEMAANWNFDEGHKALVRTGRHLLARSAKKVAAAEVSCEEILAEVKSQPVADVIVAHSKQAHCDLIVMGTHGRRGLTRLTLGSDAELVLRQSPVPVLMVRAQEEAATP